eukprot:6634-Chlamydomonas_euryale.AAC.1
MQSLYGAGVLVHGHKDGVLGQSIPKSNGAHQNAPRPLTLLHRYSIMVYILVPAAAESSVQSKARSA